MLFLILRTIHFNTHSFLLPHPHSKMLMLDNVTGGCGIPYLTTGPDLAKGNKTITRAVVVMPDSGGNPTIEYCAISQVCTSRVRECACVVGMFAMQSTFVVHA